MADIVFRYEQMRSAVNQINDLATRYKNAGTKFETDFVAAIADWEGESHDALERFITGPTATYMTETVPQLIEGLATLLSANADQMEKADQEISANIPTSLG